MPVPRDNEISVASYSGSDDVIVVDIPRHDARGGEWRHDDDEPGIESDGLFDGGLLRHQA